MLFVLDDEDSDSSQASQATLSDTSVNPKKRKVDGRTKKRKKGGRGKGNGQLNAASKSKMNYKCTNFIKV